jgi:hypothetical protein
MEVRLAVSVISTRLQFLLPYITTFATAMLSEAECNVHIGEKQGDN